MNHPTNPPVDWETLVTQEENRLYREFEGTLSTRRGCATPCSCAGAGDTAM